RLNLEDAQAALAELRNWEPDEDEIALAEAAVAAAQAGYNAALGQESASYNSIQVQAINLEQAQRDLEDAQAAYDTAYDPARDWELVDSRTADRFEAERDAAVRNLQRAQDNLDIAQANYNSTVSSSNSSSSKNAENNVLSAQLALQAALEGPTSDEIAAAESAVRQAELNYQQALLNEEADEINLQQAQLNLEAAQEALAQTTLIAPGDGVVLSIAGNVGEVVSAGSFITVANLNRPMIELYLDETDLDKVGMDYEVDVIFNALPDETFAGTVVQVDPQLYNESGITAVRAVVQLDNFNKQQTLPIGMNATVDVIGGRAVNALLVPVEALREISPGQFAVFVMVDGEPELRFVEVGLKDFTFAEILSGVELGETVTTGIIETQ
ncbi:MAG: efflux RND transporter periplasmic adaptor subunit, partial [Anaerolineae bacterium]|nr:efflux RND transporter periplasmic adaptor subunit [Anaerolineae bacterium]